MPGTIDSASTDFTCGLMLQVCAWYAVHIAVGEDRGLDPYPRGSPPYPRSNISFLPPPPFLPYFFPGTPAQN